MSPARLIERYLDALAAEGRSPHTLRAYRGDLRGLSATDGWRDVLDSAAVEDYLLRCSGLARGTRDRRRSALRGFLAWAHGNGFVDEHLVDLVKVDAANGPAADAHQPETPDSAAVEAVLQSIPRQADRDHLIFGLLARMGLRPGEALGLRVEDVDLSAQSLGVVGWGGRRRRVLIDDTQLVLRLENWLRATGLTRGPLFRSPTGEGALRYQSLAERWSRYTAAAGVRLTLGSLRQAHIADLLDGGVPEWVVRDRVGQATGSLPRAIPGSRDGDEAIRRWSAARELSSGQVSDQTQAQRQDAS